MCLSSATAGPDDCGDHVRKNCAHQALEKDLLMEVRNDISQTCEPLKQEVQHSFFAENDKVRQSSPVILSKMTYVFMVLT